MNVWLLNPFNNTSCRYEGSI